MDERDRAVTDQLAELIELFGVLPKLRDMSVLESHPAEPDAWLSLCLLEVLV